MTRPTPTQQAALARGTIPPAIGAHFVGSEEGQTKTLPLTGWSRASGDLRIPHFFGMHALQFLLVIAAALRRMGRDLDSPGLLRKVHLLGGLFGALWLVLLLQALDGYSVFSWRSMFSAIEGLLAWAVCLTLYLILRPAQRHAPSAARSSMLNARTAPNQSRNFTATP
ncbi:MAG: hypothetical protein EBZ48_01995 [Proteobacteria bacterium]|nr:hypothetical protein [Pseudomonadota bacterium]